VDDDQEESEVALSSCWRSPLSPSFQELLLPCRTNQNHGSPSDGLRCVQQKKQRLSVWCIGGAFTSLLSLNKHLFFTWISALK